ncbi:unnamed protein product [Protopolystoma xenopodis]|uniref:Uncharacterized protein n=1 Tax=Protopolystoma xenopodis TaxID=117903 RepID=A0A3S5AD04_9PLAT|nr:unnamed protein product [Protopolystoma xenopodis]
MAPINGGIDRPRRSTSTHQLANHTAAPTSGALSSPSGLVEMPHSPSSGDLVTEKRRWQMRSAATHFNPENAWLGWGPASSTDKYTLGSPPQTSRLSQQPQPNLHPHPHPNPHPIQPQHQPHHDFHHSHYHRPDNKLLKLRQAEAGQLDCSVPLASHTASTPLARGNDFPVELHTPRSDQVGTNKHISATFLTCP